MERHGGVAAFGVVGAALAAARTHEGGDAGPPPRPYEAHKDAGGVKPRPYDLSPAMAAWS